MGVYLVQGQDLWTEHSKVHADHPDQEQCGSEENIYSPIQLDLTQ